MAKTKFGIVTAILTTLIVVFAWLAYRQHQTIGVLNREIINQAARRQQLILENYKLSKELEVLEAADSVHIQNKEEKSPSLE